MRSRLEETRKAEDDPSTAVCISSQRANEYVIKALPVPLSSIAIRTLYPTKAQQLPHEQA